MRKVTTFRSFKSSLAFYSTAATNSLPNNISSTQSSIDVQIQSADDRKIRLKNISRSLEIYLEALNDHNKMMKRESHAFELGKRHLANIMGWPADMKITQVIFIFNI